MKKVYLSLLVLVGFSGLIYGQISPATSFYWENPYYINPASVNMDYQAFFSLSARKQWISLKGSPATFYATGALFLEDYHTQVGLKVLNDRIGYLNTIDVSLSYSYTLQLNWNSYLNMGLSGSFQNQSVDRSEVTMDDWNDPVWVTGRLNGLKKWNAALGIEYMYDKTLKVGLASQNVLSFFRDKDNIFGGINYLYARYRSRLGRGFEVGKYRTRSIPRSYDLEYGVCVKQYKKDVQVDGMLALYINRETQEEKFQIALLARSVGEVGILAGVKLISELKILCSYDYNFKAVKGDTSGTFEVIVTYPLKRSNVCKSTWDMFR